MPIRVWIAVLLMLMAGAHAVRAAEERPAQSAPNRGTPGLVLAQAAAPEFHEPEVPLPASGAVRKDTKRASVAPFRVITSGSSHYLVKLFDQGSSSAKSPKSVLSVFVRAGGTVKIEVPLGTYIIRTASGEKWYGYKHLFGPDTGFTELGDTFEFSQHGNKLTGHSITLYAVPGGNLSSKGSDAKSFGD
jgi:hypothetical protein